MADIVSASKRSAIMAGIRGKDTQPERAVRTILRRLGIRFRSHAAELPGTPDFLLKHLRVALFVHGCYWHRHPGCPKAYSPKTNRAFWKAKFRANVLRDRRATKALRALGWTPTVVWECKVSNPQLLEKRLLRLKGKSRETSETPPGGARR